jgi:hypothetical protein
MTTIKHCRNNTLLEIDPLNKFTDADGDEALTDACGYLLGWAVVGPDGEDTGSLEDNLVKSYHFFAGWFDSGVEVSDNGVYSYPEDPDLYPLVSLHRGDQTLHIYQYGIIAVRSDSGADYKVTRMD